MIERLIEVLKASAGQAEHDLEPEHAEAAEGAPPEVVALVRLMGTRQVAARLGWRSVESRYLGSLKSVWQMVVDDLGADDARAVELERSVQIGASAGGEVYFGLCWTARGLHVAEIDFEEGTLTWFEHVGAFFDGLVSDERERGGEVPRDLAAIVGLAPAEPDVAPTPAVSVWAGSAPPHPFQAAIEHFGVSKQIFAAGPTLAGRRVLVRHFTAGNPHTPASVVVCEADGATRALAWPDTGDVYGLALVPEQERALVCAGAPGPLLELDLVSGDRVELRRNVRWSAGFLDAEHLVVHEDQHLRVVARVSGEVVAEAPTQSFNLFVAHGRIYTIVQGALVAHALRGGALVEEPSVPLPVKLFFLNSATVHEGRRLVGSVDSGGVVTWLDVGQA